MSLRWQSERSGGLRKDLIARRLPRLAATHACSLLAIADLRQSLRLLEHDQAKVAPKRRWFGFGRK